MEGGYGDVAIARLLAAAGWVARALFPHACAGCGREGRMACDDCQTDIEAPRAGLFVCPGCGRDCAPGGRCGAPACALTPLDGLAAVAPYAHPSFRRLIQEYKYARVEEAGAVLLRAFASTIRAQASTFATLTEGAIIVPIPLHPLKRSERGFNQADAFAHELGRLTGRPVVSRLLARRSGGRAQATIADVGERAVNAAGKFAARLRLRPGARFVLVDDVATTGATLGDAARALKSAGAGRVHAVTMLRG